MAHTSAGVRTDGLCRDVCCPVLLVVSGFRPTPSCTSGYTHHAQWIAHKWQHQTHGDTGVVRRVSRATGSAYSRHADRPLHAARRTVCVRIPIPPNPPRVWMHRPVAVPGAARGTSAHSGTARHLSTQPAHAWGAGSGGGRVRARRHAATESTAHGGAAATAAQDVAAPRYQLHSAWWVWWVVGACARGAQ